MMTNNKEESADSLSKSEVREIVNRKYNSRGRGATNAEKRKRYEDYERRKKIVYELEQRNKGYLVLFLASDGVLDANHRSTDHDKTNFYILGGNSALLYVSDIAARIGRNARLHHDDDNSPIRFKSGVAKIKGLENFTKALAGIGIKRQPAKSGDEIVYFKLQFTYTKGDLEKAAKKSKAMRREANELLQPKALYPTLNKLLVRLRMDLIRKSSSMRHEYYGLIAETMTTLLLAARWEYLKIVRGVINERDGLVNIQIYMDEISDMVSLMQDLELWDVLFVIKTAEKIVKIQKEVDELIATYDNKMKKNQNESIAK